MPRRYALPLILGGAVLAAALYFYGVPDRPPGFYLDESSIAYNARRISEAGRDEYDEAWPLFFRAFGEYKNPTYVYLLAAIFRVTGPSAGAGRALSAVLGVAAALLLGLLAARCARRAEVGVVVCASALLTPWLYEASRLVFEVAAYPLLLALFLLALRRASEKEEWRASDVLSLALTLALLTYSYSIGRLLGPLFAAGLAFFVTRRRLRGVLWTWLAYALALVPLIFFHLRHPGALTGRFGLLTYVTPESTAAEVFWEFARRLAVNLSPWRMLFEGEANIRDHVPGAGSLLAPTLVLAVAGLWLWLRGRVRGAWWRFVVYALVASAVPASLTRGEFPQLRLIAVPVLLHVLTVPALTRLLEGGGRSVEAESPLAARARRKRGRVWAVLLLIVTVAQGAYFQWLFHHGGPERGYVFDVHYPLKVLPEALATGRRPVCLEDLPGRPGYIQALWYGALRGMDASEFVRLSADERAPAGAVVISTEDVCDDCLVISKRINFMVYTVPPAEGITSAGAPPLEIPIRAEISPTNLPRVWKVGRKDAVRVVVVNAGPETWPAARGLGGREGVRVRARWLRAGGGVESWPGAEARLPYDMDTGDLASVHLEINAPESPGDYVLELDVTYSGMGSEPVRSMVKVER